MSSQKTERLINLTLALLATKRYLTKSEIFKNVTGYSGSAETMERMFERDKDELRSMGIEIDVKGLDPLFEDDQGYLIRSETFQLKGNEFAKDELFYLTMAANLWQSTALGSDSKAALLKIQSLSGPIESDVINTPEIRDNENSLMITTALDAIENSKVLTFQYNGSGRVVEPLGMYTKAGFWYLVAKDEESYKSFKLLRIEGKLTSSGKQSGFKKPENFDLMQYLGKLNKEELVLAEILVRKEQAFALRSKYAVSDFDEEWDLMVVPFNYEPEIIETFLWHGENVIVLKPENLRNSIKDFLNEFIYG
jgi:proteasome accessory factor B